jgi:hypothetical protein
MTQVQDGGYWQPPNGRRYPHPVEPTSTEPNSNQSDKAYPYILHATHWEHRVDFMH